jgi:hypothetical protein
MRTQKRKNQTGEPTVNGGHFGSVPAKSESAVELDDDFSNGAVAIPPQPYVPTFSPSRALTRDEDKIAVSVEGGVSVRVSPEHLDVFRGVSTAGYQVVAAQKFEGGQERLAELTSCCESLAVLELDRFCCQNCFEVVDSHFLDTPLIARHRV